MLADGFDQPNIVQWMRPQLGEQCLHLAERGLGEATHLLQRGQGRIDILAQKTLRRCGYHIDAKQLLFDRIVQIAGQAVALGLGCTFAQLFEPTGLGLVHLAAC